MRYRLFTNAEIGEFRARCRSGEYGAEVAAEFAKLPEPHMYVPDRGGAFDIVRPRLTQALSDKAFFEEVEKWANLPMR